MNLPPLDFNGSWRKDMEQQQRIKSLAAETHEERRAAIVMVAQLREWQARESTASEAQGQGA